MSGCAICPSAKPRRQFPCNSPGRSSSHLSSRTSRCPCAGRNANWALQSDPVDNNGFVLAPLPVAPVNESDTVFLPEGLNTLKRVARLTDLNIDGSHLNLDGGFDSRHNRKAIFNAGLIPNIKENPRNRKTPKRGRKRLFNAVIHSL